EVDQPSRSLPRIYGIEENAFQLREHLDRLDGVGCRYAVPCADIIGIGHDVFALDHTGAAQFFGRAHGKLEYVFLLLGLRRPDTYPEQRNVRIHRLEAYRHAGLCAGTTGRQHDLVHGKAPVVYLREQFECAIDEAQRARRVGASAWNSVDLTPLGTLG